jgi:hypothetical protein
MLAYDEEVDFLEYQRYLRIQTNSDLWDIFGHLNALECPRRAEAALREITRRNLASGRRYNDSENLWRKFLIAEIAFLVITIFLGLTMSQREAIAPQPPPSIDIQGDGDSLELGSNSLDESDQMTVSIIGVYLGQGAENALRGIVLFSSKAGIYSIILLMTTWKLTQNYHNRRGDDPLKIDNGRLLLIALFSQFALLLVASFSNLPQLVNNGHSMDGGFLARAITILAPWG